MRRVAAFRGRSKHIILAGAVLAAVLVPVAGAQAATPNCHGPVATIVGTMEGDSLQAGPGPNVFQGYAGDDVIRGGAETDIICGGFGKDEIYGGAGDDVIFPGFGDDRVYCGPGYDNVIDIRLTAVPRNYVDCEEVVPQGY